MVDPLGIVLKAGTWYLVAAHDGQLRTYRVSRVRDVVPTEERSVRPERFDLSAYWTESTAAYERDAPRIEVTLRVQTGGVPLARGRDRHAGARQRDGDRWTRIPRGGPFG